jgi:hypothetical protein
MERLAMIKMRALPIVIATAALLVSCSGSSSHPAATATVTVTRLSASTATASSAATATTSHAPIQPNPSPLSTVADELHTGKPLAAATPIMYALRAKGFKVTDVSTPPIVALAKDSLLMNLNGIDAYLNAFPSATVTREWTDYSQGFGGIAVVGDTWSVSLDSEGKSATRAQSMALAAKIAAALNARAVT